MGISFRDVEIRTWPERGDLLVIDHWGSDLLAQYLPMSGVRSDITDITLPYDKRALSAIKALENDQDLLKNYYLTEDAICLRLEESSRRRLEELLAGYQLGLEDCDFLALDKTKDKLKEMETEELFDFLVDWHDLVERRYPLGASREDAASWIHRAAPGAEKHFVSLAGSNNQEMAYHLFSMLIDVPVRDFSFGLFLRWLYFHRTEFRGLPMQPLRALG